MRRSGLGFVAGVFALALRRGLLALVAAFGPAFLCLGQGRAKDVPQAGAGVGGAVVGHGLLLLVHLARLDGKRKLSGLGIDRRDLGVDLLADGEAVGPLLAAFAR